MHIHTFHAQCHTACHAILPTELSHKLCTCAQENPQSLCRAVQCMAHTRCTHLMRVRYIARLVDAARRQDLCASQTGNPMHCKHSMCRSNCPPAHSHLLQGAATHCTYDIHVVHPITHIHGDVQRCCMERDTAEPGSMRCGPPGSPPPPRRRQATHRSTWTRSCGSQNACTQTLAVGGAVGTALAAEMHLQQHDTARHRITAMAPWVAHAANKHTGKERRVWVNLCPVVIELHTCAHVCYAQSRAHTHTHASRTTQAYKHVYTHARTHTRQQNANVCRHTDIHTSSVTHIPPFTNMRHTHTNEHTVSMDRLGRMDSSS